jgi:hypothetical protein
VYSLFLGFGLVIGAEAYEKITSRTIVGSTGFACHASHHPEGPWWQWTPSLRGVSVALAVLESTDHSFLYF